MSRNSRYLFGAIALLLSATLSVSVYAKKGGNGKPGGGGNPPPPVLPGIHYGVQYFTVPGDISAVNNFNNLGQVVGNFYPVSGLPERHAYLFDPFGIDIPANGNQATDLNAIGAVGIPEDWYIASAVGINNQGIIVGYLKTEGTDTRRGYILDLSTTPLELETIDDEVFGYTYPRRINDNGDVLGVYDSGVPWGLYAFNVHLYRLGLDAPTDLGFSGVGMGDLSNPAAGQSAQVASVLSSGVAMRYTLDGTLEVFPDLDRPQVNDINSAGTFCGRTYIPVNRKGNQTRGRPYRYSTALETLSDDEWGYAVAINSDGDTVIQSSDGDAIHHDQWGLLSLDDLIDDPERPLWLTGSATSHRLNDRDTVTDFGQIAGKTSLDGGSSIGFILTPFVVP